MSSQLYLSLERLARLCHAASSVMTFRLDQMSGLASDKDVEIAEQLLIMSINELARDPRQKVDSTVRN